MANITEEENKGVLINEGINLKELMSEGCTFSLNFDESNNKPNEDEIKIKDFHNLCDNESFVPGDSFSSLTGLVNITEDGKVKKRILREGYGECPQEKNQVVIQYHAFFEFGDEPFDSTYLRDKPVKFHINSGEVVKGLDIGVSKMKLNERSQILVHYDYAYGKMGCLGRIPAEAMILYEVELIDIISTGTLLTYDSLDKKEQCLFENAYEYALELCTKGNNLFAKGLLKNAVYEYNQAISALNFANLRDYNDQEKQQKLLLRILTNKIVVHVKRNEPKMACASCNDIYNMVKGSNLQIDPKVYYNNAKALIQLNELSAAEKKLKIAQRLRPTDKDISKELINLNKLMLAEKETASKMCFDFKKKENKNTKEQEAAEKEKHLSEFAVVAEDVCKDLNEDVYNDDVHLPDNLNQNEKKVMKEVTEKFGLLFSEGKGVNGENKIIISKKKK